MYEYHTIFPVLYDDVNLKTWPNAFNQYFSRFIIDPIHIRLYFHQHNLPTSQWAR